MTFNDYINNFDIDSNIVYVPENLKNHDKNIAIFLHTLKDGGSQYAIQSILPVLIESNFGIYIISPEDGIYKDIFLQMFNCVVIIQKSIIIPDSYRHFLQTAFDTVLLNSCTGNYSIYFVNTSVPVIWWTHEAISTLNGNFKYSLFHPDILSYNFSFFSPWPRTVEAFNEIYSKKMHLLPISVSDDFNNSQSSKNTKFRFLIPGSYESRKGFHKVIEAICSLSNDIFEKAEFIFVGFIQEDEIYNLINEFSKLVPAVKALKNQSREEMNYLYESSDCVIVPTLLDSGPLTVVEALMHKKLCIVSHHAGVTHYLENNVNSIIYNGDDSASLADTIIDVLNNTDSFQSIAENGRKLYLDTFSPEAVSKQLKKILNI